MQELLRALLLAALIASSLIATAGSADADGGGPSAGAFLLPDNITWED